MPSLQYLMLYIYANMIKLGVFQDVSGFVDIDRIIDRINALVAENDERQAKMQKLEIDLYQVQEELEHYYVLSREQSKIIELNEKLHERTISLLGKGFSDSLPERFPGD